MSDTLLLIEDEALLGTELARLGLPVHVRSLVLNHAPMSRGITDAVYNRYAYDREKREALAAWEGALARLLAAADPAHRPCRLGLMTEIAVIKASRD